MNRPPLLLVLTLSATACQRPATSAEIIDRYRSVQCVEPSIAKGVIPATRGWDVTLTIAGGSKATIKGAGMVGGRIAVRYGSDGPQLVAVQPGDYIYPSDVRIDSTGSLLYVKARGLAGGIREETWLYEYDLRRRQQVSQLLVDPSVLPAECPMPPQS